MVIDAIISTIQKTQLRLDVKMFFVSEEGDEQIMTISSHCLFTVEAESDDCCRMD